MPVFPYLAMLLSSGLQAEERMGPLETCSSDCSIWSASAVLFVHQHQRQVQSLCLESSQEAIRACIFWLCTICPLPSWLLSSLGYKSQIRARFRDARGQQPQTWALSKPCNRGALWSLIAALDSQTLCSFVKFCCNPCIKVINVFYN